MTDDRHADIDRALRDVFGPDAGAADRIADAALGEAPSRRRGVRGAGVVALMVVAVAVGVGLWLSRQPEVEPAAPVAGIEAVEMSGSFIDGTLLVLVPGDGAVIVGPGERGPRPADGYGIVLVEGEVR